MRHKLTETVKVVFALALLGGLVWVAYALLALAVRWLASVRSDLATAIIAAAAAVLVSFVTVGVGKYLERRDAIERDTRLKKVPVYEQLISFIFGILQQGKPGFPKMEDGAMIQTYTKLTEDVIVWGSDKVLKQFGEFRVASLRLSQGQGLPGLLVSLEDLMLSIRKDLGYRNTNIKRGDVLRLFINDLAQQQEALNVKKQ